MTKSLFEMLQEEPDEERAIELVKEYLAKQIYKRKVIPYGDCKWTIERSAVC